MNSLIAVVGLTICLAAHGSPQGAAPKSADFQAVWTGVAVIPDAGDNQVTLTLKVEKGVCTGTLVDSMGFVAVPEIQKASIDKARLTFDITIANESGNAPVHLELTLDADTMTGRWWDDEGQTGAVKLTRKPAF